MNKNKKINIKFWSSIASISGVFSFVICILIIANYFQISGVDPVNTKVLNVLIERLNENPEDQELRVEIREMELLVRKAYFTNTWQIKTGGYLLLIGVIVSLIALLIIDTNKKKIVFKEDNKNEKYYLIQKKARKWITIGGIALALITLIFAFLTNNKINKQFTASPEHEIKSQETEIKIESVVQNDSAIINHDTTITELSQDSLATEVLLDSNVVIEEEPISMVYPTYAMKMNFPAFRGCGGNGIAYQTNIPEDWDGESGKNILWKIKVPLHGYNSPVIWGNYIYMSGANGTKQQVYCFNRINGNTIWVKDVENIKGSPAKKPKVTDDTGHAAATVTCDQNGVYAIFSTGDIAAFSLSGEELWSKNLGETGNHYGHSSSLYVVNNKVIIQYDVKSSPKIMALSTKTGEIVWSTDRKVKVSWASPIVVNTGSRIEVIVLSDPFATSYDSETGKKLWEVDCTYGEVGPSVAYAGGRVFAMNEYAKLVAISITGTPSIIWEDDEFLSDVPSPVATDDLLFVATSYGEVVCYDAKTGDKHWIEDFSAGIYSSPMLVENKIYLMDRTGKMHIFKAAKTFEKIGEPEIGEKSDCTPAFANGRIYIRAGSNLYCIGEKE